MIARRAATLMVTIVLWGRTALGTDAAGQVAALEGAAEVSRAGATQPIKAGDPVYVGDKLKTAPGSKLRLLLNDDSVLTLAASTEMVLTEQDVGADQAKSNLGLLGGTMRALVTERYGTPGSKFEVETPTAIAGVRGTGFVISYDMTTGTTTVLGLFDTTWVRGKKGRGEVTVGPDRSTEVRRGGLPRRPVAADGLRLRRLIEATDARVALDQEGPGDAPAAGGGGGGLPPHGRGFGRGDGPGGGLGGGVGGSGGVIDQPVQRLKGKKVPTPPSGPPTKPPPPAPGLPGARSSKP